MKFLIVDDDKLCRILVESILSPFGTCHTAYDGDEAINAFRLALQEGTPYDLICLDIMMPHTDGHQVLSAVRAIEQGKGILGSDGVKVIMTTALEDSRHCLAAFREGCEAYLTKPLREAQLLEQVGKLLGGLPEPDVSRRTRFGTSGNAGFAADEGPQDTAAPRAGRFLIVDDDPICRELLRVMLARHGRCDLAVDGREAVEAVRLALEDGRPYDLICLDIMMPGLSGHETLLAVRQIEEDRGRTGSDGVRVIMTTALCDSKHCIRAFREGCESYLTKPIRAEELFEQMRVLGVLPREPEAAAAR